MCYLKFSKWISRLPLVFLVVFLSNLGETWSKPVLAKLRYKQSGNVRFDNVRMVGGGYDNRVDDETLANSGSAIAGGKNNEV